LELLVEIEMSAFTGIMGIFENGLQTTFKWEQLDDIVSALPIMKAHYVVIAIAFYLASLKALWPKQGDLPIKPTGWVKQLILAHNVLLAVYSLIVFLETAPLVYGCVVAYSSFRDAVSSNIQAFIFISLFQTNSCAEMHGKAMMFWAWTFYLSKMYEFVDTWILVLRKIKPSFLQVYHHCGAVLLMWVGLRTRNPTIWLFVVLNSFIHTIMYSYYALTSLGIRPPVKQLITCSQLLQFISANVIGCKYYWNRTPALSQEQLHAVWLMQAYTGLLFLLFMNFSYQTYVVKASKKVKLQLKEA
jgi:hypothetical protein